MITWIYKLEKNRYLKRPWRYRYFRLIRCHECHRLLFNFGKSPYVCNHSINWLFVLACTDIALATILGLFIVASKGI